MGNNTKTKVTIAIELKIEISMALKDICLVIEHFWQVVYKKVR